MPPLKQPGIGAGVMLLRGGKVLLGKRLSKPNNRDIHGEYCWTLPGGKLEFGETPEGAAARETREECGVTVSPSSLRLVSVSNDADREAHFLTVVFLTEDFQGEPRVLEPAKISEWHWFNINKLPYPMFYPSARAIRNYLAGKMYQPEP